MINLGTGRGVTVRELVDAFEKVIGQPINKVEGARRPGDSAGSFTNANKALDLLKWKAELSIEQAIADALKWGDTKGSEIEVLICLIQSYESIRLNRTSWIIQVFVCKNSGSFTKNYFLAISATNNSKARSGGMRLSLICIIQFSQALIDFFQPSHA